MQQRPDDDVDEEQDPAVVRLLERVAQGTQVRVLKTGGQDLPQRRVADGVAEHAGEGVADARLGDFRRDPRDGVGHERGAVGAGAIGGALVMPKLRERLSADGLMLGAAITTAIVMSVLALAPSNAVAIIALLFLGRAGLLHIFKDLLPYLGLFHGIVFFLGMDKRGEEQTNEQANQVCSFHQNPL